MRSRQNDNQNQPNHPSHFLEKARDGFAAPMTIAGLRRDERSDEECDHQRQSGDEETHCDFSVSGYQPHPKSGDPTRVDFGACLSRAAAAMSLLFAWPLALAYDLSG
jgi:hypothetical protein